MPNNILKPPIFQYIRDDNVKIIRTINTYSKYNFCGEQDREYNYMKTGVFRI